MESFLPLVEYLLPDFILTYYHLTRVESASEVLHLYLEEKTYDESAKPKAELLSKGFLPEITIQDFPIRDKRVFLHIKRRRWLNTQTQKVETRDWNQVAKGTRMMTDFALFLNQIDGFLPPQYQ
ncbi:transposase family protein [Spirosoma sp. KCTC 42546]|uniref:ISAon1 family transposase N-terminal region protein n=1 Tax=Spirosoma sp. KCTC 42546 TaxID=2520506 RepID=UPI00115B9B2F|nr:transposase family protein [Spirosoma sp. KCTC 42546]QDK80270.1 transposase family protein [Spirosoma sp. KCTC 42546]